MDTDLRRPAVAGRFYSADPRRLAEQVDALLATSAEPERATMLVAPHAGYVYSGAVAGAAYARVSVPRRVVVLCPNHTGRGARRSVWPSGAWQLPGGAVPVDAELARLLVAEAHLTPDHAAHLGEHAIEVHLPFLRARRADVSVVPVCLGGLSLAECHEVGHGLARAIRETPDDVLLIASTDMSHYIAAEEARRLDSLALERVLSLDPDGLYEVVTRHDISMCGYIPTTVALVASLELGAKSAKLVRYANSGDVSGDFSAVVGYAGVVVS